MIKSGICLAIAMVALVFHAECQVTKNRKDGGFEFTTQKAVSSTDVKDQYRTGTCWSFSTLSFFESEMMRNGKGKHNLSEMYIVRKSYEDKADKYVRMHGTVNFAGGGAFHDVMNVIRNYGLMPESAYPGLVAGEKRHNHGEMDAMLRTIVDAVIKNENPSPRWKGAVSGTLDSYLGMLPPTFQYEGKNFTPRTFADFAGINPDDYISLTSFTHHPFWEEFVLEVPDNWAWDRFYNIPLDDLMRVIDNALMNDYSLAWASDVSEKGFSYKNGVAVVPEENWSEMTQAERDSFFTGPKPEKKITQDIRQVAFDNYETQDDHGMHMIGIAKDQNGGKYYIIKNSWGAESNECDGYFYASDAFVRYKTIDILVHKNAVPKDILAKLK